jgi:hypothetical protein
MYALLAYTYFEILDIKTAHFPFLVVVLQDLNSGLHTWLGKYSTTLATLPALFCVGYFQDRVSQTVSPSWLQTRILLISAS